MEPTVLAIGSASGILAVKTVLQLCHHLRCEKCGSRYKLVRLEPRVESALAESWEKAKHQAKAKGVAPIVDYGRCKRCQQTEVETALMAAMRSGDYSRVRTLTEERQQLDSMYITG